MKYHRERFTLTAQNGRIRPTHGYCHMLLRVKTTEFEAQAVFPFRWASFAREEEGAKDATLTQSGLPLIDSRTGHTICVKIEYSLGLRKRPKMTAAATT